MAIIERRFWRTTLMDLSYYKVPFTYDYLKTAFDSAEIIRRDDNTTVTSSYAKWVLYHVDSLYDHANTWSNPVNYPPTDILEVFRAIAIDIYDNKNSILWDFLETPMYGDTQFITKNETLGASFTINPLVQDQWGSILVSGSPGRVDNIRVTRVTLFDGTNRLVPDFLYRHNGVQVLSSGDFGTLQIDPDKQLTTMFVPKNVYVNDVQRTVTGFDISTSVSALIETSDGVVFNFKPSVSSFNSSTSSLSNRNSTIVTFVANTGWVSNVGFDSLVISTDKVTAPTGFTDSTTSSNFSSIIGKEIDTNDPAFGGDGDGTGGLNPGGSSILARFTPRISTGTIGAYKMSASNVSSFLSELWNTDIIEQIKTSFIGDGSNALLGLRWFYGIGYNVPTASSSPINMGNVSFDDAGSFPVVSREFVQFSAGSITVPSTFGDYRDWTLRTFKVYIPFVGLIDVDANQVCNKTLALKYHVNLTDGSATVILANSADFNDIIFTTSCSWGYDIPVRVEAVPDMTARIINATGIPSIIKSFGGMGGDQNYTTGELSPNSSVMGDFTPKLIIYTHNDVSGNLQSTVGKPSNTTQNVGSFSGYLKAQSVQVPASVQSVPAVHVDTIVQMLKDGVYV